MSKETLEGKRQRYISAVKGPVGAQWYGAAWEQLTADEPRGLVEFYFNPQGGPVAFSSEEIFAMQDYVRGVLKVRRKDLSRAQSCLTVASCLNNVESAAYFSEVVKGLSSVVGSFESMESRLQDAYNRVLGLGLGTM